MPRKAGFISADQANSRPKNEGHRLDLFVFNFGKETDWLTISESAPAKIFLDDICCVDQLRCDGLRSKPLVGLSMKTLSRQPISRL